MALPRRRVAVRSTVRPLELQMLLVVGRVGIEATGSSIDIHEDTLQPAHRKTLPEARSGYRRINCRPYFIYLIYGTFIRSQEWTRQSIFTNHWLQKPVFVDFLIWADVLDSNPGQYAER